MNNSIFFLKNFFSGQSGFSIIKLFVFEKNFDLLFSFKKCQSIIFFRTSLFFANLFALFHSFFLIALKTILDSLYFSILNLDFLILDFVTIELTILTFCFIFKT